MIDDINAAPDYGDEPPHACSAVFKYRSLLFACGETPGHAGKHRFRQDRPKVEIEWDDDRAAPAPKLLSARQERQPSHEVHLIHDDDDPWAEAKAAGAL